MQAQRGSLRAGADGGVDAGGAGGAVLITPYIMMESAAR